MSWEYMGDVNVEYGGLFINLDGSQRHGYLDGIRVTDLDSATGADGLTLIERVTVLGLEDRKRVKQALDCCGLTPADLRGVGKDTILVMLADCLMACGYCDPLEDYITPSTVIVVNSTYGPSSDKRHWEGWTVDKAETVKLHHTYGGDMRAYLEGEYLD